MNILRYLDAFEEEIISHAQVAKELAEVQVEIATSYDNLFGLLKDLKGTDNEAEEELKQLINLLSK